MTHLNYMKRYRRMALDMHIPDWDPRLLSFYEPRNTVEHWRRAGVDAAMLCCQSHVGLANWPTKVGKMHEGLHGRDLVGETDPPWNETNLPALVRHRYGAGEGVYCAADLAGDRWAWGAQAHPAVRMTVFHDADRQRLRIALLNRQAQTPVVPVRDVSFYVRPPEGRRFVRLVRLPKNDEASFELDADGCLRSTVPELELFAMLTAEYV